MTAYTVVWGNTALDEPTNLWLAAEHRARVTNAAREIDVKPLRVLFSVRESDRIVEVNKVVLS